MRPFARQRQSSVSDGGRCGRSGQPSGRPKRVQLRGSAGLRRSTVAKCAAPGFDARAELIWGLSCRLAAGSAAPRKATCGPGSGRLVHPYKVAARRTPTECRNGNLQTKRRLSPTPSRTASPTHGKARRRLPSGNASYRLSNTRLSRCAPRRGMNRAMLFSLAIIQAEWEANAPSREAMAIKRERLRALRAKRAAKPRSM